MMRCNSQHRSITMRSPKSLENVAAHPSPLLAIKVD